ncbi:MAG: phage tail protein, partial [Atopobiaceae bacterium]|nr:phage tail protein [Atopobiaceae bacterium]
MQRFLVFDHADNYIAEIAPGDILQATRIEEINAEHSLEITTTTRLEQSWRILSQDTRGIWREFVVVGPDEAHESGRSAIGTYYAVWSVQHDLSTVYGPERRPGVEGNPVSCGIALSAALDGTRRWRVGRCDIQGAGHVMMYNNSAWERIADVIAEFGGELDARISVDNFKISKREVMLYDQQGSSKVTRRFDWGKDTTAIRRTPQEGARVCRIIPIGAGEPREESKTKASSDKITKSDITKLENKVASLEQKIYKLQNSTIPDDLDNINKQAAKHATADLRLAELRAKTNKDGSRTYPEGSSTILNAMVAVQNAIADENKANRTWDLHKEDLAQAQRDKTAAEQQLTTTRTVYAAQQAAEQDEQKRKEAEERQNELLGANRKITITSVNNNCDYLEDTEAALAYRLPDGEGGWEYPTCMVENSDFDEPADLFAWAQAHLHDYTRPTPTYEASVVQYAEAGMNVQGVSLGDVVHVVDGGFSSDVALRLEARVVRIVTNELDPADVALTIGALRPGLGDAQRILQGKVEAATNRLDAMWRTSGGTISTAQFLEALLADVNAKLNVTGGYTYLVPGEGILCYDREVTDPSVGSEATRVIQLVGGGLRIASSRTSSGDWDWQTIMTAED